MTPPKKKMAAQFMLGLIPSQMEAGLRLRSRRVRERRLDRRRLELAEEGAKVSTIIFWEVSFRLSQFISLNILRARFSSFNTKKLIHSQIILHRNYT